MDTRAPRTVELGELIAAAYDGAARYSTDSAEVSWLATQAVTCMLSRNRTRRAPTPLSLARNLGTRPGVL